MNATELSSGHPRPNIRQRKKKIILVVTCASRASFIRLDRPKADLLVMGCASKACIFVCVPSDHDIRTEHQEAVDIRKKISIRDGPKRQTGEARKEMDAVVESRTDIIWSRPRVSDSSFRNVSQIGHLRWRSAHGLGVEWSSISVTQ